jgi:hypothetical protein
VKQPVPAENIFDVWQPGRREYERHLSRIG